MNRTTIKTLALLIAVVGAVMFAGCRKCSNCYTKMYEYKCNNGVDTVAFSGYAGSDSTLQALIAQGYMCDTQILTLAINNHPICSKRDLMSYEKQGAICIEIK